MQYSTGGSSPSASAKVTVDVVKLVNTQGCGPCILKGFAGSNPAIYPKLSPRSSTESEHEVSTLSVAGSTPAGGSKRKE